MVFSPLRGVRRVALFLTVLAGAALIAAVFLAARSGDNVAPAAPIELPAFVEQLAGPRDAAGAYRFAVERPDLLAQIPCYCGCNAMGHRNNLECFVRPGEGDQIAWEEHGAG